MQYVRGIGLAGSLLIALGCGEPAPPTCPGSEERPCETTCGTAGTQRRAEGVCELSACEPPSESCNGIDDDCDGRADETFPCVTGEHTACETACGSAGSRACSEECSWSDCAPPRELCGNGVDDDCDGVVDGEPSVVAERSSQEGRGPVAITGREGRFWVAVAGEGHTPRQTSLHGVAPLAPDLSFDAIPLETRMPWYELSEVVVVTASDRIALLAAEGRTLRAALWARPSATATGMASTPAHARVVAPDVEVFAGPVGAAFHEGTLTLAYSAAHVPSGVRRVRVQRVGPDAAPIGAEMEISHGTGTTRKASVAANAAGAYLVAWEDDRGDEIYTALLDAELRVLRAEAPLTQTAEGSVAAAPAVATDGSGFLVVWTEGDFDRRSAYAIVVDASGAAGRARRLSAGGPFVSDVMAVPAGDGYFVAWRAGAAGASSSRLMVVAVTREGTRRSAPVEVSRRVSGRPQMAWDGGELLFLYRDPDFAMHLSRLACE